MKKCGKITYELSMFTVQKRNMETVELLERPSNRRAEVYGRWGDL